MPFEVRQCHQWQSNVATKQGLSKREFDENCCSWPLSYWILVGSAWVCCSWHNDQHKHGGWPVTNGDWRMNDTPESCVTKLVTSTERRWQTVGLVYCFSTTQTHYRICLLNDKIVILLLLVVKRHSCNPKN